MMVRINLDDVLKASTTLTRAQVGSLLITLCKEQLNSPSEDYTPIEREKFLWDSFQHSIKVAKNISKRNRNRANTRWSKEKKENTSNV